jgi:benzoyl-CoA reductase/2-hydroxyglutaryl-CoA dehydratase subunit BcrC/BadD/HgdB
MKRIAAFVALSALAFAITAAEPKSFGKPLAGLALVSLADVLAKPENGKQVRLLGTIERVCQNKGCWLELKQGSKGVHVTFEAYSFFVPKDSMGKRCVVEGRVVVRDPLPEEVEHKKAEGASAAAERVSFEATGVEIR